MKRLLLSGCDSIILLAVAISFLVTDRLRYVMIVSIPDTINHQKLERKLFLKKTYGEVLNLKVKAIIARERLPSMLFGPLLAGIRSDINRFVDEVYAPHQIRAVLKRQYELSNSETPRDRNRSLLLALAESIKNGESSGLREAVKKGFEAWIEKLRNNVEEMRNELFAPVRQIELQLPTVELVGRLQKVSEQIRKITLAMDKDKDYFDVDLKIETLMKTLETLQELPNKANSADAKKRAAD